MPSCSNLLTVIAPSGEDSMFMYPQREATTSPPYWGLKARICSLGISTGDNPLPSSSLSTSASQGGMWVPGNLSNPPPCLWKVQKAEKESCCQSQPLTQENISAFWEIMCTHCNWNLKTQISSSPKQVVSSATLLFLIYSHKVTSYRG